MQSANRPWIREFVIDGVATTDRTYRTGLIEGYVDVRGRSVLDVGAADGYESRAVARLGADRVVSIEGKRASHALAVAARDFLGLGTVEAVLADARRIDADSLGTFDVVLCFGLLYHMQNPFNLLKRLRCVTRQRLLLETHVAPTSFRRLLRKHVVALPFEIHCVELDGVPFEGKMVHHRGHHDQTKGSLDAPWSFWLTPESLVTAVRRAGFTVVAYHHGIGDAEPPSVRKWGAMLGLGQANTKAWIVAAPASKPPPLDDESVRIVRGDPLWSDGLLQRIRRRALACAAPRDLSSVPHVMDEAVRAEADAGPPWS